MKLKSFIFLAVIGLFFFFQWQKQQQAGAIGIIGGADGPTAIFLASNTLSPVFIGGIVLLVVLAVVKLIKKR